MKAPRLLLLSQLVENIKLIRARNWTTTGDHRKSCVLFCSVLFCELTQGDLIYTWRILHGKLGEELMENYQVQHDKISRGHDWKLFKPRRYRLGAGLTLSTRVVNNWNLLPDDVVEADTEEKFKSKLDSYLLTTPSRVCGLWKPRSH